MSIWKAIFPDRSARYARRASIFLVLSSLLVPALSGWEPVMAGSMPVMEYMEIRQAIELTRDAEQRAFLTKFMNHFHESDTMHVTDQPLRYEIIVTHPSSQGMTGGAEQYFLDKKTGKWEMGWHEHPMDH